MKTTKTTPRKAFGLLLTAVAAVAVTGCKHYDALVFASNKQVGVKVGVDSKQIPEVSVGFNSQDFALVPVYKAGVHDGLSGNHPVVAGVLRQAVKSLETAQGSFDTNAKMTASGKDALQLADELIAVAIHESGTKGKTAYEDVDRLLQQLKKRSGQLIADADSKGQGELENQIALLRQLIEVEVQKPTFIAEFKDNLKYVGEETGPNNRKDAYSVFGSFRGRGSASSTTGTGPEAKFEGGLAQFFATGVAAQILAQEGGAAAINTRVKPAAQVRAEAEVAAIEKRMVSDLETVMDFVTRNGQTDRSELEKLLKGPDGHYLRRSEDWPNQFGGKPADKLRDFLTGEGNRHVEEMARRARQLQ